uniref:Arb2 domain-containing protein n=1 Tax=Cynoglossus semilaevis TaxID=244447 RepID=A0A3P8VX56_CYNSE
MNQRDMQVKNKVCAVALTDSAHNIWLQETSKGTQDWMQQHCCNWISSAEPLDTPLEAMLPDCANCCFFSLAKWKSTPSIELSVCFHIICYLSATATRLSYCCRK